MVGSAGAGCCAPFQVSGRTVGEAEERSQRRRESSSRETYLPRPRVCVPQDPAATQPGGHTKTDTVYSYCGFACDKEMRPAAVETGSGCGSVCAEAAEMLRGKSGPCDPAQGYGFSFFQSKLDLPFDGGLCGRQLGSLLQVVAWSSGPWASATVPLCTRPLQPRHRTGRL